MSLDAFIRAAGGVMGSAREGFGVGDVIGLDFPLPPVPPTAPPAGVGAAADAHEAATEDLVTDAQRLAQQDTAGDAVLAAAVSQSQGGRMRMDKVIASAIADVEAMGLSTSTPQGKQALIEAIGRHLRETKATVGEGTADAGTHAAASEATAAGYRGIGMQGVPGGAMPMGGMPSMGGMPGIGSGGGMPSMGALSGLSGLLAPSANPSSDSGGRTSAHGGSAKIDKLAPSEVQFHRKAFPGGEAAYRGYINKMLDTQGVTDPKARDRWMTGYLTAARRESSFNPLAINLHDSNATSSTGNAADMMPNRASRGGVQTIPSTFAAYHQAGTSNNIYDPVANLCASRNYLMARYGVAADGSDLGKIAQFNPNSAPRGY